MKRYIITDLKIEERCWEIMKSYESRIKTLEYSIDNNCDEKDVKLPIEKETEKKMKKVKELVRIEVDKLKEKTNKRTKLNN